MTRPANGTAKIDIWREPLDSGGWFVSAGICADILCRRSHLCGIVLEDHQPDRAFGINVAGAMMGGLAEYSSMALGFQYVVLIAILFYVLSAIALTRVSDTALDQEAADAVASVSYRD